MPQQHVWDVITAAMISSCISAMALFTFNAFPIFDSIAEEKLKMARKSVSWWAIRALYYSLICFSISLPIYMISFKYKCKD